MAEERLRSVEAFSIAHAAPLANSLGVHKKLGGGTAATATTADPNCPKAYSRPYNAVLSKKIRRKGGRGDVRSDGICLPKSPSHVMKPCFPRNGKTPARPWEAVNECLILLWACVQLLLSLLSCLYLSAPVLSL